jgi:hypothetical protein
MRASAKGGPLEREQPIDMADLIFVGAVVAFFAVSALYVRFCDRL